MSKPPIRLPLRALLLSALFTVGVGVACSNQITTPQAIAFGTYTLKFVNGDTLPVRTGEQDGFLYDVTAGSIVAKTDQTCDISHTFRLTASDDQSSVRVESETEQCTWQLIDRGFHVRFPHNGALLSGLFEQNAIWVDYPDGFGGSFRFMYERTGSAP